MAGLEPDITKDEALSILNPEPVIVINLAAALSSLTTNILPVIAADGVGNVTSRFPAAVAPRM